MHLSVRYLFLNYLLYGANCTGRLVPCDFPSLLGIPIKEVPSVKEKHKYIDGQVEKGDLMWMVALKNADSHPELLQVLLRYCHNLSGKITFLKTWKKLDSIVPKTKPKEICLIWKNAECMQYMLESDPTFIVWINFFEQTNRSGYTSLNSFVAPQLLRYHTRMLRRNG